MSDELNAPIDDLHTDCLDARDDIRDDIDNLKQQASTWTPRPLPDRKQQ
jgi:hypothetical protein